MMWIAVVAYFALACAVVGLLFLPTLREHLWASVSSCWQRATRVQSRAQLRTQRTVHEGLASLSATAQDSQHWLRRHAWKVAGAIALLSVPPLLVFALRGWHTLDAYDDAVNVDENSVVAALLHGEQLVPPPPLPPEVFTTAEVEQVRPQLASADRRWELLDADFRQRLLLVYRLMREEHGYEMVLLEGYRSPERQTMLAAMGSHVTNAAAWQSYHQHGLAADSAFLRDGKLVISERDPWAMKGYELYGELAQRVGLTWGGRWQNMDLGHVELRKFKLIRPKVGG